MLLETLNDCLCTIKIKVTYDFFYCKRQRNSLVVNNQTIDDVKNNKVLNKKKHEKKYICRDFGLLVPVTRIGRKLSYHLRQKPKTAMKLLFVLSSPL
jgi:hypothetical protein